MQKFRIGVLFVVLIAMVVAACQPKGSAMLSDTDKAAIKKVSGQALAMLNAPTKDWPAFVKFLYAEDAMALPPNGPAAKGHEAIIGLIQTFPSLSDYMQEPQEIEGFGNLAYDLETYSLAWRLQGFRPSRTRASSSGSGGSRLMGRGWYGVRYGAQTFPNQAVQHRPAKSRIGGIAPLQTKGNRAKWPGSFCSGCSAE